jgi:hypothetical protein
MIMSKRHRNRIAVGIASLALLAAAEARASSHSDAPLIKQDPQANLTDVYAFVGTRYDNPSQRVLNVLVSVRPFSEPGDGVVYDRFADDALYSIHVTNPGNGSTVDRYDFRFSSVTGSLKNPNTILSYGLGTEAGPIGTIGDARQNYTQLYSVSRTGTVIATGLPVAPPNVGGRTTPGYNDSAGRAVSGALDLASLDPLTRQAISPLSNGAVAWAGPREDGFYADTPGIFDLLDPRIIADKDANPGTGGVGQDGGGIDGFQGFNVLTYGLQIPIDTLTTAPYIDPVVGSPATGVGIYASVSRPRITLRRTNGAAVSSGSFIQVNRLGNPLFNEALVALADKDRYNRTNPTADASLFRTYAENPELAFLINFVLFGDSTGSSPLPTTGRTDLASIFVPDVVRVNTTTAPVRLPGQTGFSRLGILGSDVTGGTTGTTSSGWPNGRRIGDDVVDIALTALSRFTVDIGDNVNANDQLYNRVFPYLGTPHAGPTVTQRSAP